MRYQKKNAVKTRLTLIFFMLAALHCAAHSVVKEGDQYHVSHEWKYQNRQWSCNLNIPVELYRYYQGRAHQSDDMVQFVLSDYDRSCVRSLVASFREGGNQAGYSDHDNMRNVISFVQSLRYVTDMESKRTQEYARFPVETLVDGKGDCEDLAILAAAILHEMGYKVLLVILPEHMALAVDCGDLTERTYYTYNGSKYYFLEVTNSGWNIGQIPNDFRNCEAKLVPLVYKPRLRLNRCSYQHDAYYESDREVPYKLHCELENAGPGKTDCLSLHVLFKRHNGTTVVDREFLLEDLLEGVSVEYDLSLPVPRPFYGSLEIRAEGLNFSTESMLFEKIDLE